MRWQVAAAACAVSLAGACVGGMSGEAAGGTRVDSLGVAVWTIPAGDLAADIRLERLAGFAMPDTGWAVWQDGIAVDTEQESIYVLDESTPRVLVFDFEGRFVEELGRQGDGPGEYDSPTALALAPNRDLLVMDPGSGFVHRWSSNHQYAGRDPISVGYWGPGFAATGRELLYTTAGGVETGTMIEALVAVSSSGVDTLATVESYWRPLTMPCGRMPVPEVFSQSVVWAAGWGYVVVSDVPRYDLALRDGDALVAIFRRDIPPRQITQSDAEGSVPAGPLSFLVEGCGMTAAGVVRDAGFVREVSPFFHLVVDPNGRVWAVRGIAPKIDAVDLLDPIQGFLGSVKSPVLPVAFLDPSRFVAIAESDWGSVLELWRVVPGR